MAMFFIFLCLIALTKYSCFVDATTAFHHALFVFGDSLVDVGNNIYLNSTVQADYPPYGRDYFHRPTGRFSNGRNSVDFIAQSLGLPFPRPSMDPERNFTTGVNFASGGSGILNTTSKVMVLSSQIEQFKKLVEEYGHSQDNLAKSLFVVSSGGNDIFVFLSNPAPNASDYVQAMAAGMRGAVQNLYDAGARKIVVYGIGPVGCVPALVAITSSCLELGNTIAKAFNNATEQMLNELRSTNPGLSTVFTKAYDPVNRIITERSNAFGFRHGASACCGGGRYNGQAGCGLKHTGYEIHVCPDASNYFFWDSVHPTEHADEVLTTLAFDGDYSYVTPFNISTLVWSP